ncbi:Selenium metabolism protein YedF [Syntrophomonas zehnderi OL-4]|uniref:Selenium metabolism protein YedF n=1 Tax=Syntrophomonas zehnderi OL-4 TaxID=690567 RepID=A0A0E4G9X3_9FIRM|nr:sulfurtransferase-like selenium metabolism protein YedF [Syntrophomonas zehnderi]CFX27343.1 Selenium metabolism protein YedF [Syntrophomonas zehnderi OL-4]
MKKVVDARGLSCPQPVVLTKKALDSHEINEILTIVDNPTALENVVRMVKTLNLESMVDEKEGQYYIRIYKEEGLAEKDDDKEILEGNTVILIGSNVLGNGDDKLGSLLMKSFLYTLTQMEGEIQCVIFMNSGVLLNTAGSELADHIQVLSNNGIEVLSCGTCLDYYNVRDKLMVGSVSNMYTITEKILHACKVITL